MNDPGYAFLPLPPTPAVRRVARPEARHDRLVADMISAKLTFRLVAEQPVHVGSGFKVLGEGRIVRGGLTSAGVPCIPGTTLKGVLRSRYESITRSCAVFGATKRPEQIRSSQERYHDFKARFTPEVADHEVFQACRDRALCPACGLFGRMSLRSRVLVSDFVAATNCGFEINTIARSFSPNLHHVGAVRECPGQRMLEITALHGRKFACGRGPEGREREPIEVIGQGSAFAGEIRVVNVTEAEFGGLLAALGVEPVSRLKIGAGKGRGFGRVRVEQLRIDPRATSRALRTEYAEYTEVFKAAEDAWPDGLARLVRIHVEGNNP